MVGPVWQMTEIHYIAILFVALVGLAAYAFYALLPKDRRYGAVAFAICLVLSFTMWRGVEREYAIAQVTPLPTTDPLWQWDEKIVQHEQTAHAALSTSFWYVWQIPCPTGTPTTGPDLTLTRWPNTPTATETSTPTSTATWHATATASQTPSATGTLRPTFSMPTETPTATLVALKGLCEPCVSSSECQPEMTCYQYGLDKKWRCVLRSSPNGSSQTCYWLEQEGQATWLR